MYYNIKSKSKLINKNILYFIIVVLLVFLFKYLNHKLKKQYTNSTEKKKLAFCFLIYGQIHNIKYWNQFFKNVDKSKYNIYIHFKNDKDIKNYNKYKLSNCIPTAYGDISVVMAQILILKEALKDKNNKHFIWLSGNCLPLKSFDTIYNYLDTTKSYYNISPDSQVFPRADKALKYLPKNKLKKANMASIINRKHAKVFVDHNDKIKLWFSGIHYVDEVALISILHYLNLENELILTPYIAAGSIIWAQWADMDNYKLFKKSKKINEHSYKYICEEELDYIIKSKSLFGRKFLKNCGGLDKLVTLYNS